ncbi:MAG TPA: amidohydrolase family protein [Streptosporangiaceae bacterium]|jgi:imidazolonepropionase-like amidohydrolase
MVSNSVGAAGDGSGREGSADADAGGADAGGADAITDVRLVDGAGLSPECTVLIDNGVISAIIPAASAVTTAPGAVVVQGRGGTLLPGLIDAHVHLLGLPDLERATQWGVTTMLDMGTPAMALTDSLRHRPGLADIRGSGNSASAPGGIQTTRMGMPAASAVTGPGDAPRFVADRVAEGADYVKVIVEDPAIMGAAALDVATIGALVDAAHQAGLKVIAHATTAAAVRLATTGGADVVTHAPLDAPLGDEVTAALVASNTVVVPTLTMMRAVAAAASRGQLPTHGAGVSFDHARATVSAWHRAGLAILAGTDSNMAPRSPAQVPHGESLHEELALLVDAGQTPADALLAATAAPAAVFGLTDRGVIEPGYRADLLLIDGDPVRDIRATRNIRGVWLAGLPAARPQAD